MLLLFLVKGVFRENYKQMLRWPFFFLVMSKKYNVFLKGGRYDNDLWEKEICIFHIQEGPLKNHAEMALRCWLQGHCGDRQILQKVGIRLVYHMRFC